MSDLSHQPSPIQSYTHDFVSLPLADRDGCQRAVLCRNTTLNTCLEAPNMQTAFDTAERRFGKRRPGSASVRRVQSPPSAEPASESAINNPVFSPVPQGPTETHAEAAGPSHDLDSQGAAASSSATAALGRGGEQLTPMCDPFQESFLTVWWLLFRGSLSVVQSYQLTVSAFSQSPCR